MPWEEIAKLGGVVLISAFVIYKLFNLLDKLSDNIGRALGDLRDSNKELKVLIENFINNIWKP